MNNILQPINTFFLVLNILFMVITLDDVKKTIESEAFSALSYVEKQIKLREDYKALCAKQKAEIDYLREDNIRWQVSCKILQEQGEK